MKKIMIEYKFLLQFAFEPAYNKNSILHVSDIFFTSNPVNILQNVLKFHFRIKCGVLVAKSQCFQSIMVVVMQLFVI